MSPDGKPPEGTSPQEWVLAGIERIRSRGSFPSYELVEKEDPELLGAALRFFGGWEWALVKAGEIPPRFDPEMFFDHKLCAWVHDALTAPIERCR